MKYNHIKATFLPALLFLACHVVIPTHAGTEVQVVQIAPAKYSPNLKHYLLHILGDIIGLSTSATVAVVGFGTGAALATASNDPSHMVIPSALGTLLATYIYYKTPQWTDDLLLDCDKQRTTKQNLISFLCRIFIPVPLINVVIAEAVVHD
jgi:hypothetical protein